jgi:hypothetical protein
VTRRHLASDDVGADYCTRHKDPVSSLLQSKIQIDCLTYESWWQGLLEEYYREFIVSMMCPGSFFEKENPRSEAVGDSYRINTDSKQRLPNFILSLRVLPPPTSQRDGRQWQ